MSVVAAVSAPAANHELANVVAALLPSGQQPNPNDLLQPTSDQPPGRDSQLAASLLNRLVTGPSGLGTSAAGLLRSSADAATRTPTSDGSPQRKLSCPPVVGNERALVDQVNTRLIDCTEQGGIPSEQLDRHHRASIGRLMMLAQSAAGRHRGVAGR